VCWVLSFLALPAWPDNELVGTWTGHITGPNGGRHGIVLELKTEGGKTAGTLKGGPPSGAEQPIEDARLDGDRLSFKVEAEGPGGERVIFLYEGRVTRDHIQGTHEGPHQGPGEGLPWEVTKASARPTSLSEPETIAALKVELREEAEDGRFSGAALIARAGEPIFQAAHGYADRDRKIRNAVRTKFRFGSMGKMFTGVAILQLVQADRVKLDDPVSKYLPNYPNKEAAGVTIYQLLTHTGGTGDIFLPEFEAHRSELKALEDYVALYGQRGLRFTPGSRWEYSNYGFIFLGRIIEVASGQSYYDYVRDHIFSLAGMGATGNLPEQEQVQNLAIGYTTGGPRSSPGASPSEPAPGRSGSLRSTEGSLPYRGTSAGGGYSTVGDLLKFAMALTSNKLLDARYTELLTTGKVVTPRRGIKYAFGFEEETTPENIRFFGHGGGAPGMNGRLSIFPTSGYVIVVLANLDPPAADAIAQFIEQRLQVQ
jgi:D-alanyl-D-alanine carboxypeptidase